MKGKKIKSYPDSKNAPAPASFPFIAVVIKLSPCKIKIYEDTTEALKVKNSINL